MTVLLVFALEQIYRSTIHTHQLHRSAQCTKDIADCALTLQHVECEQTFGRRARRRNWQKLIYLSLKSYIRLKNDNWCEGIDTHTQYLTPLFSRAAVSQMPNSFPFSFRLVLISSLAKWNLFKSIILSIYFIFAYYRLVRNSINHNPNVIL